jgi:hypothetical protein
MPQPIMSPCTSHARYTGTHALPIISQTHKYATHAEHTHASTSCTHVMTHAKACTVERMHVSHARIKRTHAARYFRHMHRIVRIARTYARTHCMYIARMHVRTSHVRIHQYAVHARIRTHVPHAQLQDARTHIMYMHDTLKANENHTTSGL